MKLDRRLALFVALALTAVLLVVWLRGLDRDAMRAALLGARLELVIASALLTIVHLAVRTVRWRWLVQPSEATEESAEEGSAEREAGDEPAEAETFTVPPYRDLFSFTAVGYAVTFIAPGRLGEVVRPALLWRKGVPAGRAFASIILERLLDIATLIVLLTAFVLASPAVVGETITRVTAILAVVGLVGGSVGLLLLARRRLLLEAVVSRLSGLAPKRWQAKAEMLGKAFLAGFEALLRPGAWWRVPALSFATWLPVLAATHCGIAAARVELSPASLLLIVPISALGIAVPTVAGVGGYHVAVTHVLDTVLGVPREQAAAAAVVAHAVQVLPVILLGLACLWRAGLSLEAVKEVARTAPAEGPS